MIVAAFRKANRNAFRRTDQSRVRFEKHAGFADLDRLGRNHLRTGLRRRRGHFVDVGLIIGRRAGQFRGPRHRRQKLYLCQSFAWRLVGEPIEPLAPMRQCRYHRIAPQGIGCGVSDFGLRRCDVVHKVAAHDPEPVIIITAKFHRRSLILLTRLSRHRCAALSRGILSRLQIAGKRVARIASLLRLAA